MAFAQSILAFIVVIGVVVLVHELGHFLAARSVGIRVERFSIGYPPRMIGKKVGDTDYCVSWLPLGGYVKMAGMIDESLDHPEKITGAPDEFMSKNFLQKVLVICAGVIMNFLLACGIYTGVTMVEGVPEIKDPVVETVSPGFPAEAAGIEPGDRFIEAGGQPIHTWDDLVAVIHAHPEQPLKIRWERDGQDHEAEVTPRREKSMVDGKVQEVGLIGISPRATFRPAGFVESLESGVILTGRYLGLGLQTIKMLVTGQAGIRDLGGPVLIAKWSGESARSGMSSLLLFIAFISINIGLINILPIPVLDGGHLAMIVVEGVTRRPISTKIKMGIQQVGMIALLGLMAVIIFNDLGRVGLFEKLKGLF
jgi:regulator of sigma E protease